MMQNIAVLGSTGSIGRNALTVLRRFPGRFKVVALSANSNAGQLISQAREFKPRLIAVNDPRAAVLVGRALGRRVRVFVGQEGIAQLAGHKEIDKLLLAISGSAALPALLSAVNASKQVALANKEALVMAGPLIMQKCKFHGAKLLPIDSEQSAIWQCLQAEDIAQLRKIYLTASGGSLRGLTAKSLKSVSLSRVLKHPRWKMGRKITVDSATLMNKGLELMEAMYLFSVKPDNIEVVVHPEAAIHSMVEFIDGTLLAQLSATDMRIPIQYALTYPQRLAGNLPRVDLYKLRSLHFEKPNFSNFPCLGLAYQAARKGGTMPAVLNAANEVAVQMFIRGQAKFMDIPRIISKVMKRHEHTLRPKLSDILDADGWARREARCLLH